MQETQRHSVSIPGLGRSPGVENGNPLQYPCLENSMNRDTVHGVTKNGTQLSTHACNSLMESEYFKREYSEISFAVSSGKLAQTAPPFQDLMNTSLAHSIFNPVSGMVAQYLIC